METFEAGNSTAKNMSGMRLDSRHQSDHANIETEPNYLWSQLCTIQKTLYDVTVWLTTIECFGRFSYTMASVVAESERSTHYESETVLCPFG